VQACGGGDLREMPRQLGEEFRMNVRMIGIILLVLGVLAFVVPIPQREDHSVKIGDAKIGVQTESSQKLPPAVGIVLLAGGVLALVMGSRKS
jgi:di/tricarboxylate transporter